MRYTIAVLIGEGNLFSLASYSFAEYIRRDGANDLLVAVHSRFAVLGLKNRPARDLWNRTSVRNSDRGEVDR